MKQTITNRDFSHLSTLINKVNIPNGILSLVRSQPIFIKPYSSTTSKNQPVANSRKFILTLDLETRRHPGALSDGRLEVISSSIYDGKDFTTHYLLDYNNEAAMLQAIVKTLTSYNGYSLYIHNFSRFDGIFLFKYLIALKADGYEVTFLKRDDKFIKISILKKGDKASGSKAKDKFNLEIYDSYLLLPNSLNILSNAFSVTGKLDHDVLMLN